MSTQHAVETPTLTNRDLGEIVHWLTIDLGYPFDWSATTAPPTVLWEAIVDFVAENPGEAFFGAGDFADRNEVEAWMDEYLPFEFE